MEYTYTFINNGTDFIVPTDYVLIINRHLLYFHAFFGADGCIVQLQQIRQCFDDKLSIEGVLCDRVVPEPKHLQFVAVLQAANFKEIGDEILPQIQLRKIRAMLKILELSNFIK